MTSSLVGSEMCIRDSCLRQFGSSSWEDPSSARWDGTPSSPSSRRRPVSYTHLTLPTICSV
eukprot:893138-Prorocentrum_lima.AAC.1